MRIVVLILICTGCQREPSRQAPATKAAPESERVSPPWHLWDIPGEPRLRLARPGTALETYALRYGECEAFTEEGCVFSGVIGKSNAMETLWSVNGDTNNAIAWLQLVSVEVDVDDAWAARLKKRDQALQNILSRRIGTAPVVSKATSWHAALTQPKQKPVMLQERQWLRDDVRILMRSSAIPDHHPVYSLDIVVDKVPATPR